jgi:hypothetical protein
MVKSVVCFLSVLCLSHAVFAADMSNSLFDHPYAENSAAFKKVISKIKVKRAVTRSFVQIKKIKANNVSLVSSGLMLISQSGVCWVTEKPVNFVLKISKQGIWKKNGDNPVSFTSSDDGFKTKKFVEVILALFSADEKILTSRFDAYFVQNGANWKIGLVPVKRMAKKVLKSIVIKGSDSLKTVVIAGANGDVTTVNIGSAPSDKVLSFKNCVN